jgi:AcrR family transcriptional regulator
MPRATPLPPEERRRALVAATLPLLVEHGRGVTSRQIADAAGVAEGTIFRAFGSKDELVEAAALSALDPAPLVEAIGRLDPGEPLRERMLALAGLYQARFHTVGGVMRAMGWMGPPATVLRRHHEEHHGDHHGCRPSAEQVQSWRTAADEAIERVLGPDADRLRVSPRQVGRLLWMLTFSGSHPEVSGGEPLTAEDIVDTVLHGVLRTPEPSTGPREAG